MPQEETDTLPQNPLDAALAELSHTESPDIGEIRRLLAEGASPDARDEDGVPALHSFAEWGNIPALRILLEAGADVHATDDFGDTALHKALLPQASLTLLLGGASPSVKNGELRLPASALNMLDGAASKSQEVAETRRMLEDSVKIEEGARRYALSDDFWKDLWPDNPFGYPGPAFPVPHHLTLQYFLHKAEETGAEITKAILFDTGGAGEGMSRSLIRDAGNLRSWKNYCEKRGAPMTQRDWETSETMEQLKNPDVAAGLFDAADWRNEKDLSGLYDLFNSLPQNAQNPESVELSKSVSKIIGDWLSNGEGRHLSQQGLREFKDAMPEEVKPFFTNYHQHVHARREQHNGIGR